MQLVTSPELSGVTGQYFENGKIVDPAPLARDEALARRLWQESERLTGLGGGVSTSARDAGKARRIDGLLRTAGGDEGKDKIGLPKRGPGREDKISP